MRTLKLLGSLVSGAVLLFGLNACDSLSDINDDPNNPSDAPENLQLPALLGNFSYEVVGNEPARTPSIWMQQLAVNGSHPSVDTYDLDESDVNNLWQYFSYTDVMYNARLLSEQATRKGNFAYAGIAKIILAWNLSVVTDLWNEVPYSQAFEVDVENSQVLNPTPGYDTQEEVYAAIFDLLDAAIADLNRETDPDRADPLSPGRDDLLYGGNLAKWERLAYTLKARYHMRLSNAPNNAATDRAQQALEALQNGFTSNVDDADFAYFDSPGQENPFYQWTIDGKWDTDYQMSAHYIDLLKERDDPRLPIQARPAGEVGPNGFIQEITEDPEYVGHENGANSVPNTDVSSIGDFYSDADAPLTWISYAEAKFLEAEATLITSSPAAADPIYREAIAASLDKLGVSTADKEAYLAARPALTSENALEAIMTEKYIANFLSPEVYNDWRRTGYPELEPVTQNSPRISMIPVRYPYPSSELNNNASSWREAGVPVGFQSMTYPVWWDATE